MRNLIAAMRVIAYSMLALGGAAALADDGLSITIANNTTDNLVVTVFDKNAKPPRRVLISQSIYGNASVPVTITADSSGLGHLTWTAVTKDAYMGNCGHGDSSGLHDGDTVNIRANGHCGTH